MSFNAVANANGDSFLNRCWYTNEFFNSILGDSYTAIIGWAEPYPLLILVLILLIFLPSVFSVGSRDSFLKISRVYNFIRLGAISILHQIGYSYTFAVPVSYLISQPVPCVWSSQIGNTQVLMMPSSLITSAAMFAFGIARFSGANQWIAMSICTVFLTVNVLLVVAISFNSIFQAVTTIFMSYILHFLHIHIPFRYVHLENVFWGVVLISVGFYCIYHNHMTFRETWYQLWFGFVVIGIDELMLLRHQKTRGGFSAIERPADIHWSVKVSHTESIRLLNSEEEENFTKNLQSDIRTSIGAFVIFFSCVLIRRVFVPQFFTTVTRG